MKLLPFLAVYLVCPLLLMLFVSCQGGGDSSGPVASPTGAPLTDYPDALAVAAPENGYQVMRFEGAQFYCRYYEVSTGRFVPGRYSACRPFDGNGLAVAKDLVGYRNGLIDRQGEWVVRPTYGNLMPRCGTYFGDEDEKDGQNNGKLFDKSGRTLVEGITDVSLCDQQSGSPEATRFLVEKGPLKNLYAGGKLVFPWSFETMVLTDRCPHSYVVVGRGGKFGVYTAAGVPITEGVNFDAYRIESGARRIVLTRAGAAATELYMVGC